MSTNPNTLIEELFFDGLSSENKVYFCISYFRDEAPILDLQSILHSRELEYFQTLRFERRIRSYLAGRYAAKKAASQLLGTVPLESICIDHGFLNQPIVVCPDSSNTQVSITHTEGFAAALAFSERFPLAIDFELILSKPEFFMNQFTPSELEFLQGLPYPRDTAFTVLWTVKEALSKILKTGLTAPLSIFEVSQMKAEEGTLHSTFTNFTQYSAVSFVFEDCICSIVFPKKAPLVTRLLKESLARFIAITKIPSIHGGDFSCTPSQTHRR